MTQKKNGQLPVGTLEAVLAADDIKQAGHIIEFPEWGCSFRVRGLTRGEARRIGGENMSAEDSEVFALVTAVLEPKLSEEEARRILTEKSFGPTERLLDEILELSGMGAGFR
jgi:hypothetical protein